MLPTGPVDLSHEALEILSAHISRADPNFTKGREPAIGEALAWLQNRHQLGYAEPTFKQDEVKALALTLAEIIDKKITMEICQDELFYEIIKSLVNKNINPKTLIEAIMSKEDLKTKKYSVPQLLSKHVEITDDLSNQSNDTLQHSRFILGQQANSTPFRNTQTIPYTSSLLQPMRNLSIKDAIDLIPKYNGFNIPLTTFVQACRESLTMIQRENEGVFTRLIKMRLFGEALKATQGKIFLTVDELAKYLDTMFGSAKTCLQLGGELAIMKQKDGENGVSFANRIRTIAQEISEAAKRESRDTDNFVVQLEKDKVKHFIRGLRWEVRARMGKHDDLEKATAQAVEIERELVGYESLDSSSTKNIENKTSNKELESVSIVESKKLEKCANCQKLGHNERNCWGRKNNYNPNKFPHNPSFLVNKSETARNNELTNGDAGIRPPNQNVRDSGPPKNYYPRGNFRPDPNRSSRPYSSNKSCNYCKKQGHWKEECRKREYNNRKRVHFQENGRSFSAQGVADETLRNQRPNSPVNQQ